MTAEELKALPKVELHCHLDGSLSHTFIEKRLGRKVSQSELSVSDDCRSLNDICRNLIFRENVLWMKPDCKKLAMMY